MYLRLSYSYWSILSILNPYLRTLGLSESTTGTLLVAFTITVDALAPFSGYFADFRVGNFHTQLWSYWVWSVSKLTARCLGAVVLFCTSFKPLLDWVDSLTGTARGVLAAFGCVAMLLQAAGYGMIYAVQPGASVLTTVLVADQFDPVLQQQAQAAAFPLFYFFVTLGSFGGQALGPLIQSNQQVVCVC